MKKYEEMTVKELREESKKKGLRTCTHSRKFTKTELIENLKKDEEGLENEEREDNFPVEEHETEVVEGVERPDYIKYAGTLEEIVSKYHHRKSAHVYENILSVGCDAVFVQSLVTVSGKEVRKLRTAVITSVDRDSETVHVQMRYGDILELSWDDLLYIRDGKFYPSDIYHFLVNQRRERLKWKKR